MGTTATLPEDDTVNVREMFVQKARQKPLSIVYPEGDNPRVVEAACKAAALGIARPIVLGDATAASAVATQLGLSTDGVEFTTIESSAERLQHYADEYARLRDIRVAIAQKLTRKPLAFAGMMVKCGDAGGLVGGIDSATASVIQAAAVTVGYQPGISTPSSFFAMVIPEFQGEKDKVLIFADCAVTVQPDVRQLAEIAVVTGRSVRRLFGMEPKVALLSFSTKGSASHADTEKVVEALGHARALNPGFEIDGEMQGDAALVARVAQKKAPGSTVAGLANVLVFPDLDAGNIAYKLVQYLGGATALGPVLQGFASPVSDLSRGATADDIVGVTAITVCQGS